MASQKTLLSTGLVPRTTRAVPCGEMLVDRADHHEDDPGTRRSCPKPGTTMAAILLSRFGGGGARILRHGPAEQTGYARARRRLRQVGLPSKMSSRPRRGNGRASSTGSPAVARVLSG